MQTSGTGITLKTSRNTGCKGLCVCITELYVRLQPLAAVPAARDPAVAGLLPELTNEAIRFV